jgi:FkbM family methyltransferase
MMPSARWMRKTLARWLPERVKARFRARLFGYGAVPADAVIREDAGSVVAAFEGITLRAPVEARADLAYHLAENTDSVQELASFVRGARERGGLLMDVGAARGLFSALWCLARDGNHAVAYEPSPVQVDDACRLAEMNGIAGRMRVRPAAVGASPATVRAAVDALQLIDLAPRDDAASFELEMTTLADECARLGVDPDAVKIDVEGHELAVLRGAETLLAGRKPLLFLELHLDLLEHAGQDPAEVVALLTRHGYRFESTAGRPLRAAAITGSAKAVLRFVAR